MLDNYITAVKSVLNQNFDKVVGLYDGINLNEHKNENLCFVGIDEYSFSEPELSTTGMLWQSEVKYLIKALGAKSITAEALCTLVDDTVIPALKAVTGVSAIKRGEAEYLREQGRYCLSLKIIFLENPSVVVIPPQISFSVGGTSYSCMNSFAVSRTVKTGETPTLDNGIRSRIIGLRPAKITVKGSGDASAVSGIYSGLSSDLGSVIENGITVGGMSFSDVALTELSIDAAAGGDYAIIAVFTEVNET